MKYDPTAYNQPYHLDSLLSMRFHNEGLAAKGFTIGVFRLKETRPKLVFFKKGVDVGFIQIDGAIITFHRPDLLDHTKMVEVAYNEELLIDYLKGLV